MCPFVSSTFREPATLVVEVLLEDVLPRSESIQHRGRQLCELPGDVSESVSPERDAGGLYPVVRRGERSVAAAAPSQRGRRRSGFSMAAGSPGHCSRHRSKLGRAISWAQRARNCRCVRAASGSSEGAEVRRDYRPSRRIHSWRMLTHRSQILPDANSATGSETPVIADDLVDPLPGHPEQILTSTTPTRSSFLGTRQVCP